jgi:hypothetical protein
MPMPNCDVCGAEAIGVACSRLGPISFAYCRRCSEEWTEPYGMVVGMVAVNGGKLDYFHEGFYSLIESTLKVAGKTMEQFMVDVANEKTAMDAELAAMKTE